jgi:hypothetical protein
MGRAFAAGFTDSPARGLIGRRPTFFRDERPKRSVPDRVFGVQMFQVSKRPERKALSRRGSPTTGTATDNRYRLKSMRRHVGR